MLKPFALCPGDQIGIAAPSSPVPAEDLQRGVAVLEARGYRVKVARSVLAAAPHCDYLAGTDDERAEDLNSLLTDPTIDAVFCARGGYGSMRLFDLLDWEHIAPHSKVFVGYSDITSLHTAFARLGWVTFHGTMVASLWKLDQRALGQFWRMLESPEPAGDLRDESDAAETIVPGTSDGELAGGNLCLLAHACGSRFAPDFRGKIVLLEDVNSAVYHADRDLTQLLNAGLLDDAAAFVIGNLTGWDKHESGPLQNAPQSLWTEFFGRLGKPTIAGFHFGHEPNPLCLPLGVRARLNADSRTLTVLESPVRARPPRSLTDSPDPISGRH